MPTLGEEKTTYDVYTRTTPGRPATPVVEEEKKVPPTAERPPQPVEPPKPEELERTWRPVIEGATAEGFIAGGAGILAILGLLGILPEVLLSIATIALGAAFLYEGWGVAARFSELLRETSRYPTERYEFGGGLTAGFLGGLTGVVLGILSLIGVMPMVLVPVAAMVYGATLIFGSGVTHRLSALRMHVSGEPESYQRIARESVAAATGVQSFVGLGSIVLGILALSGYLPLTLSLAAMLAIGFAATFSGTAVCQRAMSLIRR